MATPLSAPVVTAVPVPGVTAAERLAAAQERVDELDLILEEKLETLGAPGIVRPKDALLFVKDLEYKEGTEVRVCSSLRASACSATCTFLARVPRALLIASQRVCCVHSESSFRC